MEQNHFLCAWAQTNKKTSNKQFIQDTSMILSKKHPDVTLFQNELGTIKTFQNG